MTELAFVRLGRALCLIGAGLGGLGILAWLLRVERVLTVFPDLPPTMPNSAFALVLLGIAAASALKARSGRGPRLTAMAAATLVLAVSLATVAEYAVDTYLFLDQLVPNRGGWYYPLVSSPPSAIAFALLAAGVLFFDVGSGKRFRPSEWLILAALLIATTALLGYLYGASSHYRLTGTPTEGATATSIRLIRVTGDLFIIGTSFSTALGLFLISVGLFLGRPDWGTMRIIAGPSPGGLLLRRLMPVATLVPIGFAIIASRLPGSIGGNPVVLAGLTEGSTILSLCLLGVTAHRLNREHDALEHAHNRTSDLIESASEAIFIADLDGRLTDVNEAGSRLTGYSREALLGKNIIELTVPEDEERLRSRMAQLLDGHTEVGEWTGVRKDGSRFPVEVSAKILPDGRWQGIVRDITERKWREETLRISEAKFSALVSMSADAIIAIDKEQRITLFNTGAEKIFGYSGAEMIGARLDVLIPERYREMHARHVERFMAGPDCARVADARGGIYGLRRNGEEFPASASIAKVSVGGESIGRVALRDITESNRLYQAAIHAIRARDEMLGIVAHDLRNPLQIVMTNAYCLRRSQPSREMAAEIVDAAARMNRLIQDLLDVTSIESGRLSLRPERVDAAETLSQSADTQTALTKAASLELRTAIGPDLPDIWADPDRILQVFENLIGNAIKFTKAGGHITLGAEAGKGEVVFSVSDTGSGIADSDLPYVFDRFWQSTHGAHRGSGLGLAIVKGIVEAHGGRIWVRSTAAKGTTFLFTIPTVSQVRQRSAAPAPRVDALPATVS